MFKFHVSWEIELEADTPEEAVRKALEAQRDNTSLATIFNVINRQTGVLYEIDLSEKAEKQILRVEK